MFTVAHSCAHSLLFTVVDAVHCIAGRALCTALQAVHFALLCRLFTMQAVCCALMCRLFALQGFIYSPSCRLVAVHCHAEFSSLLLLKFAWAGRLLWNAKVGFKMHL